MGIEVDLAKLLGVDGAQVEKLNIGVAISGGRDSVALLHLLFERGYRVTAINVEHGIRGEESVEDSRFVAELCESMGVPLLAYSVDAPAYSEAMSYTLEQGARALRYSIFDKLLSDGVVDYVALAHHLDDQIETVLMRILRGTGIRGLKGMQEVNGRYIRPLLKYSRADIDRYIKENSLNYRDDSTNGDAAYTRNFLRGELNVLKTRFPSLGDAVTRLCASARETEEFVDSFVPEPTLKDGEAYVKTSDLANVVIAKRAILKAANMLGVRQDIEERHYNLVLALAGGENGKYVQLTHSLDVHKQGDYLVFSLRNAPSDAAEIPFGEGVFEKFGIRVDRVKAEDIPAELKGDGSVLYVDADSVAGAVIRRRRDGDSIKKFGGGSKSLGNFLTDKKVPKRKRDGLAVIAVGGEALAVAGVDISARCRVSEGTKAAYRISLLR